MRSVFRLAVVAALVTASAFAGLAPALADSPFTQPWRNKDRALVLDAYEHNAIDWAKMVTDKRIAGFIGKASDGDGEPWNCAGENVSLEVCRLKFRRYFVARELYQTRRLLAKSLGLKWGSYHLGRKGNPIAQADHYLEFAEPTPDEVIVLDIEGLEDKWMSLEDAETFARRIHQKTGRYPMLYVNGSTAKHIADRRDDYRLLSRLKLWYARFAPEIEGHFPKGNWESYTLWQFAATPNCNARRCPYRVPGTPTDIDVNVADMTVAELRAAWPFDGLVEEKPLPVQPVPEGGQDMLVASAEPVVPAADAKLELVPLPATAPRGTNERPKVAFVTMANLMGETTMAAPLSLPEGLDLIARMYRHYGAGKPLSLVTPAMADEPAVAAMPAVPAIDPMTTASVALPTLAMPRAVLPEVLRAELPGRTGLSGAF
ncbi:MAG: glycoside hydrolase family 25 protein [Rhizobiaceae bacterium]|nr:glycoside hydrolase family 25 protein [Rhizobiaceae bacterium]